MQSVRIKDKNFSLFIKSAEISAVVDRVAERINKDFKGENPIFLVVLNGAFIFASDLIRRFREECEVSFVKLKSYVGTSSSESVKEFIGLERDIRGRTVIIVEDIIDTGNTMAYLLDELKDKGAGKLKIAALLFKPEAFKWDYKIDYIGMEIPNDFIIGYGLDYDGYGRNYPDIYKIGQ